VWQQRVSVIDDSKGAKRNTWGTGEGREMPRKAIQRVASLPYRVGVRYDVHGEPFLNTDVVEGLTWLTNQPNVAFVEVQPTRRSLRNASRDFWIRSIPRNSSSFAPFITRKPLSMNC
jgi:hypothetical protein